MGSKEINCQKLPLLSPLRTGVILADFHNVGITPDLLYTSEETSLD